MKPPYQKRDDSTETDERTFKEFIFSNDTM